MCDQAKGVIRRGGGDQGRVCDQARGWGGDHARGVIRREGVISQGGVIRRGGGGQGRVCGQARGVIRRGHRP